MYNKYFVYVEDTECGLVFKIAIAAACEESARIQCQDRGLVVAVRDVTEEIKIDSDRVRKALRSGGFPGDEVDLIVNLTEEFGIAE